MTLNKLTSAILFVFLTGLALTVFSQATAFTYQGSLTSNSSAANGNHDFEFLLFDAGGTQLGSTVTQNGVAVTNGIFAVSLDFGSVFPGAARFLEIHVRTQEGGVFTTLSPRQPLTSTPYSVKSLSADNAVIAVTAVVKSTTTSSFGFYSFDNVPPGFSYTLRIKSRLFRFQPQVVVPTGDLTGVDFVGFE